MCLKIGRCPRSETLATNMLNQLSFSCERMAGFGVKKRVYIKTRFFLSAIAHSLVLFQSTVLGLDAGFGAKAQ